MSQKLCVNCKYLKNNIWCISPVNGIDLVSGETKSSFASVNRSKSELLTNGCGPDGVHWQEKTEQPKKVSFFKRLFGE